MRMSERPGTSDALASFTETWSDGMLALHIGPNLTCAEAEALAELLRVNGKDPDDLHHIWPAKHADPVVWPDTPETP